MLKIYTAQYKYNGPDRQDITIKGNQYPGNILAPTWEMVRAFNAQKLTQWDYTIKYYSLIANRLYWKSANTVKALTRLTQPGLEVITLVCFCPPMEFCHRILAARMLEEMGLGKYMGERLLN